MPFPHWTDVFNTSKQQTALELLEKVAARVGMSIHKLPYPLTGHRALNTMSARRGLPGGPVDRQIKELLHSVPAFRGADLSWSALAGGITNRNFLIEADGARYVLRLGGANTHLLGIDREREYVCALAAAAAGVGPEVVAFLPEQEALVTRFAEGLVLAPEDMRQPDTLRRTIEALRRFHESPPIPGAFSPFETVRGYYALALQHGVAFPEEIDLALALLSEIEEALPTDEPPCPCHNDLLPSNFIDDGASVRIIDWEYAAMGDRCFDLGNLAVNHLFDEEQERQLLLLYFGEVRSDHLRRLRLMRLASDMRESMWSFLQAGISTLEFDFPAYGQTHLERFLQVAPRVVSGIRACAGDTRTGLDGAGRLAASNVCEGRA